MADLTSLFLPLDGSITLESSSFSDCHWAVFYGRILFGWHSSTVKYTAITGMLPVADFLLPAVLWKSTCLWSLQLCIISVWQYWTQSVLHGHLSVPPPSPQEVLLCCLTRHLYSLANILRICSILYDLMLLYALIQWQLKFVSPVKHKVKVKGKR